ncbi:MAG: hypothetical protein WKF73_03125 [Nocardioidaceae bacterium]
MAETRFRDADGRLRRVTASAASVAAARSRLKEKLCDRPGYANGGAPQVSISFSELADLWLADLELRDLAEGTRHGYREHFRLDVRPAFDHYTLGEITTGRVEWFLRAQASYSTSRAKQSRTLLNRCSRLRCVTTRSVAVLSREPLRLRGRRRRLGR